MDGVTRERTKNVSVALRFAHLKKPQKKQTIIECLKQAITGEHPPNMRSCKSFVHDPRVRGG